MSSWFLPQGRTWASLDRRHQRVTLSCSIADLTSLVLALGCNKIISIYACHLPAVKVVTTVLVIIVPPEISFSNRFLVFKSALGLCSGYWVVVSAQLSLRVVTRGCFSDGISNGSLRLPRLDRIFLPLHCRLPMRSCMDLVVLFPCSQSIWITLPTSPPLVSHRLHHSHPGSTLAFTTS